MPRYQKALATGGSGGVAAGGGRPSTSFALPGYPRCKVARGQSEAGAQPCRFTARRATNGVTPPRRRSRRGVPDARRIQLARSWILSSCFSGRSFRVTFARENSGSTERTSIWATAFGAAASFFPL